MSTEVQDKQSLKDENEQTFILLKDEVGVIQAKSVVATVVNVVRRSNSFNALKGSLFNLDHNNTGELNSTSKINLVSVDNADHHVHSCNPKDIRMLSKDEYNILLAVPTHHERYVTLNDLCLNGVSKLTEACKAKKGDHVYVYNDRRDYETQKGVIMYIGCCCSSGNKAKKGVFFHVSFEQLCTNNEDKGEINCICNKNSKCVPVSQISSFSTDDDIFFSRKKNEKKKVLGKKQKENKLKEKSWHLREKADMFKENASQLVTNTIVPKQSNKKLKKGNKQRELMESLANKISIGNRVVCFLDDNSKPVASIVRYLGKVDGTVLAGVELDIINTKNNLGNYYKGNKLFDCDLGKGLIVTPDTLLKEEEFLAGNDERETYVTINDLDSGKHELEKKKVKPSEAKNVDPYKEQRELFKKYEEDKLESLNIGHTLNSVQHIEDMEKNIESEINSHDKSIQGIKRDFGIKTCNQMPNQDKQDPNLFVGTSNLISKIYQNNLKRENISEKNENHILSLSYGKEFPSAKSSLQLGSLVEIIIQHKKFHGVLKWKGMHNKYPDTMFAGIELENSIPSCTDGTFIGQKYFHSPLGRAFFIKLHQCKPDSRFQLQDTRDATIPNMSIKGSIMPKTKLETWHLGRDKGIQGHYNSCYMDSTLFAMFGYSHVFDVMLNRKRRLNDIEDYDIVQTILKEQIVNPLRKNGFVSHQSVLELRKYLNELGNIGGFMTEEKDPEEFIVLLFEKVLKVDAFVKLCVNDRQQLSHLYQIFFPKEENNPLPSIQYLLQYSFLSSNLQLAEIPSVMILQMPRFGQQKLYQRIQITSKLDITPLLAYKMHLCIICGQSATCYCPDCACLFGWEIVHTYLCQSCWLSVHKHPRRNNHQQHVLKSLNSIHNDMSAHVLLELFAVVCIEKSHYVSFVKCGTGEDEKWLFFDSMADRIGGENGHNIPEVTVLDNLKYYLNGNPLEICELDKKTNEQIIRVFDDSSLCFYYNKGLSMYR